MELVLYIIMSWLCITYIATTVKRREVIKVIIIYMMITIIFAVVYIFISVNLHLVIVPDGVVKHVVVLLHRNIVRPLLVIGFILKFDKLTSLRQISAFILLLICFFVLELLNINLKLYVYKKGIFLIPFLINSCYILIAIIIYKLLNFVESRSGKGK